MTGPCGAGVILKPQGQPTGEETLLGLGPLVYVTMRGTLVGGALTDLGSANMTFSASSDAILNDQIARGPDGDYVRFISGTGKIVGTDHPDLSPQAGNGLTVFCLAKPIAGVGGQQVMVSKAGVTSQDEWFVGTGFNSSEADEVSAGVVGGGINYFTRLRETNTDTFVPNKWKSVIARYGPTTTSQPQLRLNGADITGVTTTTGTMISPATSPLRIGGRQVAGSGGYQGCLAHVAIYPRVLSDAECQAIESAFIAEGWLINPYANMILPDTLGFWDLSQLSTVTAQIPNLVHPTDQYGSQYIRNSFTNAFDFINGRNCIQLTQINSNNYFASVSAGNPLKNQSRPMWCTWLGHQVGDIVYVDTAGVTTRPHAYNFGAQITINNGIAANVGARDLVNPHVYTWLWNGASSKFFKDGVFIGTFNAGTGVLPTADSHNLAFLNVSGGGIGTNLGQKFGMAAVGIGDPGNSVVTDMQNAWMDYWNFP